MKYRHIVWLPIISILLLLTNGCGSNVGTGVSNPPSEITANAGAAVGALFSTSSSSNLARSITIKAIGDECTAGDPGCTCDIAINNSSESDNIGNTTYREAGTYGSNSNPVTVTAEHFCTQTDGTTENSGLGPDNKGRFAGFTMNADVPANCTETDGTTSTISFKTGSSGIWRNVPADGSTVAHQPEAYGAFTFEVDGTEVTLNCTMFLAEDETVLLADCSDSAGDTVSLDSNATCVISSGS